MEPYCQKATDVHANSVSVIRINGENVSVKFRSETGIKNDKNETCVSVDTDSLVNDFSVGDDQPNPSENQLYEDEPEDIPKYFEFIEDTEPDKISITSEHSGKYEPVVPKELISVKEKETNFSDSSNEISSVYGRERPYSETYTDALTPLVLTTRNQSSSDDETNRTKDSDVRSQIALARTHLRRKLLKGFVGITVCQNGQRRYNRKESICCILLIVLLSIWGGMVTYFVVANQSTNTNILLNDQTRVNEGAALNPRTKTGVQTSKSPKPDLQTPVGPESHDKPIVGILTAKLACNVNTSKFRRDLELFIEKEVHRRVDEKLKEKCQKGTNGFYASMSETVTFRESDVLVFNNVKTNYGNAYDNNTGAFTAQHDGNYFFSVTWLSLDSDIHLQIMMNGAQVATGSTKASTQGNSQISALLALKAGDVVTVNRPSYGQHQPLSNNLACIIGFEV